MKTPQRRHWHGLRVRISELLVVLFQFSLNDFEFPDSFLSLHTCSVLTWLEFDVCVAVDEVSNALPGIYPSNFGVW